MNKVELTKEYAISCPLSGLKYKIQIPVGRFQPRTLQKAPSLAKLQELAVDSHNKRHQRGTKSVTGNSPILATPKPFNYSDASQPSRTFKNPNQQERVLGAGPVSTEATRNISNTDFDERRAEGLCFWCEEKYVPGRQCKKKQLYRIELVEEENGGG